MKSGSVQKEDLSKSICLDRCLASPGCPIVTNSIPSDAREKVCDIFCHRLFETRTGNVWVSGISRKRLFKRISTSDTDIVQSMTD